MACHDHNEAERAAQAVETLADGVSIALVSDAGTPLISDPGYRLVSACRAAGHTVCPIPGASALIAALSVSGLPTDRFVFEGFLPAKANALTSFLASLKSETRTLVFYESSHRISRSLAALRDQFGATRKATVARELTKRFETVLHADLGALVGAIEGDALQQKGEFVIVVAGAEPANASSRDELSSVLAILLDHVSVSQAATIAAALTGTSKNKTYRAALELARDE